MVRTFLIVNVGMMLFRRHTISQWGQSLARIFTDFDGACLTNGTALSLGNDWQDFLIMGIGVLVVGIVEVSRREGPHHSLRAGSPSGSAAVCGVLGADFRCDRLWRLRYRL